MSSLPDQPVLFEFFHSKTALIYRYILSGTGKSVLLREIVKTLRSGNNPTNVAITASTGIAGVNIGGSTIHSFSGILLGKESAEDLAYRISNTKHLRERWVATKTLIIDESTLMPK